ncbi:MAG: DNA polymerase I [Candidatus Omnitrophota bacterium]
MNKKEKNIYLIDGTALCYRSYYAIQDLSTSKGVATNAIYGFIKILKKLIRDYSPERLSVVFDLQGPTTRHEKYESYKIHRKPIPEDLVEQIPKIKEIVKAFNIPICQMQGYEADDIIATLTEAAKREGLGVVIVTSDKDALQLVDDSVRVISQHTYGDKVYDADEVRRKYGVAPDEMVELMGLMGDASDNIPGVKGIGLVTAGKLIKQFGSVKRVYENINEISSAKLRQKLEEGRHDAELSRELVELDRNVPVSFDFKKTVVGEPDRDRLAELYSEFEFTAFLGEVSGGAQESGSYSVKEKEKELRVLLADITEREHVAIYISEGLPDEKISGVAFSLEKGTSFFVPAAYPAGMGFVKEVLEREQIRKTGYDIKNSMIRLEKSGIRLRGAAFDVMLADYLIDPSLPSHDLAGIARRHIAYSLRKDEKGLEWDKDGQGTLSLSGGVDHKRACEKCDIVMRLYGVLEPLISEKKLEGLFQDVEIPLIGVLARMEVHGVGVDTGYLKTQAEVINSKLDDISENIYKIAGERFNINSPKQLQTILFEKLKLPASKKTKTGRSTDESVLTDLARVHELPRELLSYRELNKLKTAYYDSIIALTDPMTHKLHAHFNQAVTATGRLSSSEPNLQNIPVKTDSGRRIRRAFVPSAPGKMLLAADYSQIELRILAHLSEDAGLMEAFAKGEDVHRFTASRVFDTSLDNITDEMRAAAKTFNFGIIYGISAFRLAKDMGIALDEAQKFIDAYFRRYSGVSSFIESTIKSARENGFVTTILNRRRYIPEINSRNERVKGFAERVAVNTPVQGSAADLIKLAMIACYNEFRESEVEMIIQVHDELVFEAPEDSIKVTAARIKDKMENVIDLKVPLIVDIEAGYNWMDMERISI